MIMKSAFTSHILKSTKDNFFLAVNSVDLDRIHGKIELYYQYYQFVPIL